MSIKVMQLVWDQSRSKNTQRLVLLAIADNAADDGTHSYPSVAEIQRKANCSESAVHDAIKGLEALGELTSKRNGAPRGRTNMYAINLEKLAGYAAEERVQNPDPPGSAPSGVQNPDPKGAESGPGTVPEPSVEPSSPPGGAGTAGEPNAGSIVADWIDYCSGKNLTLTRSVIGRYAKSIKALLDQGFAEATIKHALARMLERGQASRPGLLDSFVVEVQAQTNRPTSGAPAGAAGRPAYQTAAEKQAARNAKERAIAGVIDHLIEELGREPSMSELRTIRDRAEKIYEDQVINGTGSGYGGHNPVDAEWTETGPGRPKEVTAHEDDRGAAVA